MSTIRDVAKYWKNSQINIALFGLENQTKSLEKKQTDLIENNKQLISDIGLLSSSTRIEQIAVEELGMHQASSDEIDRVEIKRAPKGK